MRIGTCAGSRLKDLRRAVLIWLWRDARRPLRIGLILEAVGWAAQLARPEDTFATSHIYDVMAAWLSEPEWAALFALDAALLLWGLFAGSRRRARVYSAIGDAAAHAVVVYSAVRSAPAGTGLVTQSVFLTASWLLMEWEAMDA